MSPDTEPEDRSLHHALMRGIEIVYQLEEGEVLGEALPSTENRRAVLAYEATEGGAGVLNRVILDPQALGRVARTALGLMHYEEVDEAIAGNDPALLETTKDAECVHGCYRCLLSYYNQPDHELIDRTSEEATRLLIQIARGKVELVAAAQSGADPWRDAFEQAGLPPPDAEGRRFDSVTVPYAWKAHYVAAHVSPLADSAKEQAERTGGSLFELPADPAAGVPDALVQQLKGTT